MRTPEMQTRLAFLCFSNYHHRNSIKLYLENKLNNITSFISLLPVALDLFKTQNWLPLRRLYRELSSPFRSSALTVEFARKIVGTG